MPTLCIQCALRAFVDGESPPTFDETPEAHAARVHPDPAVTQAERADLERRAAARIAAAQSSNGGSPHGQ